MFDYKRQLGVHKLVYLYFLMAIVELNAYKVLGHQKTQMDTMFEYRLLNVMVLTDDEPHLNFWDTAIQ